MVSSRVTVATVGFPDIGLQGFAPPDKLKLELQLPLQSARAA
jgi:hypothetical protein